MKETAQVTNVVGESKILRGNGSFDPEPKAKLLAGDRVLTETPSSSVDVSFNDVAGIRVLGSSECVIADAGSESMRLELKRGNAILNLEKLPEGSRFSLETPTAIAGVRGTQFWGRVQNDASSSPVTTLAVREGSVQVTAKMGGSEFLLMKGQALDIPKDATEAPIIREALKEEMEAMAQASSIETNTHSPQA